MYYKITGHRLEYNDPKFIELVNKLNKTIEVGVKFDLIAFVPWVHDIFPEWMLGTTLGQATLKEFHVYAKVINHLFN